MKRIHVYMLAVLMLASNMTLVGSSASAWEFEMAGSFNWSHEWYNQTGTKGFFGPYNVDNSGTTKIANLNFWNGGQFDTNIITGAAAGWSYFNVELEPTFKVNEAITMTGLYHLGTYNAPDASNYMTQDAPGSGRAFSDGQWTMYWITASTPWGVLALGKRPWTFGTALQYDGEDAASTESIALVTNYGPLDIGLAFYPYRFAGSSSLDEDYEYGDPYDLDGYQYFSRADTSGTFSKDFLGFVVYHSGPMRAGILGSYGSYHIGPEGQLLAAGRHDSESCARFGVVSRFSICEVQQWPVLFQRGGCVAVLDRQV